MRWRTVRAALAAITALGCSEPEPLDLAWNRLFEVVEFGMSKGSCALPNDTTEAPEDYVGVGLGRTFDGVFNATTFWYQSPLDTPTLPFSNAVLSEVSEQRLHGFFVETSFDSQRSCLGAWTGIDAQLVAPDDLVLITRLHVAESTTQVTSKDCQSFVEGLIDKTCDETLLIRGRAVPDP